MEHDNNIFNEHNLHNSDNPISIDLKSTQKDIAMMENQSNEPF